jgi:nicotinic acid phosphoribosyltransferase
MWSYRIQVATLALSEPEKLAEAVATVTCERQKELVEETLDQVGVKAPAIRVDSSGYAERVRARVKELVEITGDAGRIFEVGLRAASCLEQHLLALEAAKSAGLKRTSHVWGAQKLGLTPVGTMGHEHVQRFGSDDAAFRAMSERRPQRSSYLLDTFDTIASGIPTALALIAERKGEGDSIRYDSGDKEAQYRFACAKSKELRVSPVQILEDGFDAPQTKHFEKLRLECGVDASRQVYGYGGYLIASTAGGLTRDRVAAVYKLSQTGRRAAMKFGNDAGAGKQSIPGRPVALRRHGDGAVGWVGQQGEAPPAGVGALATLPLRDAAAARAELSKWRVRSGLELSVETKRLVEECTKSAFSR